MTENQADEANVDPLELRKFSEQAHRWWDPEGECKPLHEINPLRLYYVEQRAGLQGQRVVDIGCGGGLLAEAMAARGAEVVGIDMAEAALGAARLHLRESGLAVDYRRTTAEALAAAEPATFDVVTCMEMLEHVPDPAAVVQACGALAKPGGQVFFSTLNRNPKAYLLAVVGAEYVLGLLPKGTHDYARFIRPAELSQWARSANLSVEDLTGLHYNPLTRRYSLGRNVDVNYLMHTAKPD